MELQIIERSLPKKPKLEKDPFAIEKEEMERIGKCWINLARKEIPKHHKIFINFHRRQLTDAKRIAEMCQREVGAAKGFIYVDIFLSNTGSCTNKFVCDSSCGSAIFHR